MPTSTDSLSVERLAPGGWPEHERSTETKRRMCNVDSGSVPVLDRFDAATPTRAPAAGLGVGRFGPPACRLL